LKERSDFIPIDHVGFANRTLIDKKLSEHTLLGKRSQHCKRESLSSLGVFKFKSMSYGSNRLTMNRLRRKLVEQMSQDQGHSTIGDETMTGITDSSG